jgi:CBS domain-containing protein
MTEPAVSIDIRAPASEILRLFARHAFHHLPVVDGGKVVGMLSSADILKLEGFLSRRGVASTELLDRRLHVGQLMRRPPITVSGTQSMEQAISLMTKHGIHAVPVTDPSDRLLGILTTTDIIAAVLAAERGTGAQTSELKEAAGEGVGVAMGPGEMRQALALAAAAAERGDETGKLAQALLHSEARVRILEAVLTSAERYVHAGQDQGLHRLLLRAITKAKQSEVGVLRERL